MSTPHLSRRAFALRLSALAAAGGGWSLAEARQAIQVMVGFPAGGGSDVIARLLADKLQPLLNEPVVVENRPGAGGQVAAQLLKAAKPDGQTLFLSHDHTISILPQVVKNAGFEPRTDFVGVGGFATFVNCLAVSPGTPVKNFAEFVDWLRANPGKANVGVPAPASTPEFLVQLLAKRNQLNLVAAPYKGSAPMIADMLGNQIAAGVGSVQDFIENVRAGKLRVIAVLGGKRQPTLPEVPTFTELGVTGLEDTPFYGVFAPKGTPQAFVNRFSQALAKVVAMPDVVKTLTDMGLNVAYMSPQDLARRETAYRKVWEGIIHDSGFKPQ
jgi:tripartite-type tricarboxylate transporter receptor subunit TctC